MGEEEIEWMGNLIGRKRIVRSYLSKNFYLVKIRGMKYYSYNSDLSSQGNEVFLF